LCAFRLAASTEQPKATFLSADEPSSCSLQSVIPVEMCYLGWQESLEQLARLVEPDIPDNG